MNKLKIANLYYYKSRAITLTKLKKSTCKVPVAYLHSDVDHYSCKVG
jgi:hypothetical protein